MMTSHCHMRTSIGAAVALAGALLAAPAAAQDQTEFPPTKTPGWSFTPSVTVSTLFDSNVALASSLDATHHAESDRLFVIGPAGQIGFVSPRTELGTGYHGYLRRYTNIDELDGFDQHAYLSLRRLATRRVTLFVDDNYAAVSTTDEIMLNGLPFVRTGSRTNSLQAGMDVRLTKMTDLSTSYELQWVDFDRATTLLMGGFVNAVRTELSHHFNQRLALGGEYSIRFANLAEGAQQLTFQDTGATVHYALAAHTMLSASAGVSYLRDRLFDLTRLGPYVRAGVTHKTDRATVSGEFERTFVPSFGFGGSNRSQEVRATVQMPLTVNRMYVQGSAAWRRSDPLIINELALDSQWIRATLGYSLSRWLRTEGFYAYTRQDSRIPGGLVDRHRGGVQIVISQPMRIQ